MEKKYKLLVDDTITVGGRTLYRIEALRDFANVKKDEKGGYIEKEENLSQEDNCWVSDNAWVCDNARVRGNICVCSNAWVCSNAQLIGGLIKTI